MSVGWLTHELVAGAYKLSWVLLLYRIEVHSSEARWSDSRGSLASKSRVKLLLGLALFQILLILITFDARLLQGVLSH